jgi:hypothetical protein
MQQQRADLAYQEFMRQQQYPTQQLQQFSSLVQGFPFSFGNYGQQVPSPFQQTVGTGLAAYGLGRNLGFFNQGGGISSVVNRQPGGSITPKQLQDRANQLGISVEELEKLLKETREKSERRPGIFGSLPGRIVSDPIGVAKDYAQSFRDNPVSTAGMTALTLSSLNPVGGFIRGASSLGLKGASRLGTSGKLGVGGAGLLGADFVADMFSSAEKKEKEDAESKETKKTASDKGAAKAEIPSYLSAYNDSIKLLQERQKDIAGRREEGKAAIDEAFNLQLVSLGTLIATTPKDKLYEKLPKEITKFTKKKDLVELQDKYDKQELTNLLAQASIGESLSKIISEVGGSKLPQTATTEAIRLVEAKLGAGTSSTPQGQQALTAVMTAFSQLPTQLQNNSDARFFAGSKAIDALSGNTGKKQPADTVQFAGIINP